MLRLSAFFFIVITVAASPSLPLENERLVDIGRLWITVKYFHPYLSYRSDVDWDKALADALPGIRGATTPESYAAAADAMLKALHDPLTRVDRAETNDRAGRVEEKALFQRFRIYHGLPPEEGSSSAFYSAFLQKPDPGPIQTSVVALGANVFAHIRLSEQAPENTVSALFQTAHTYTESAYPSVAYRLLAAYKLWGVMHYFFAYKDLLDDDWDKTFADYLPKFIAAQNAREYHLTVAEMISFLSDSNAVVQSDELTQYFGEAPVGLRLRLVDKKPVVTEVLDKEAEKAGVKAGDIVLNVDGEPMGERIKREANYISASTTQHLGHLVMRRILNGKDSSIAVLTITGPRGEPREVRLVRSVQYVNALEYQRTGEVFKVLDGNIRYADLNRLLPTDVDVMFNKLRNTKAIIFDARGALHAVAGAVASRLTEKESVQASIVTGPLIMEPDLSKTGTHSASYFETQTIPPSDEWKYKNKTVMLIDERTAGEAEHCGLFLEAANRTEFIGTPSAGADSDVSNFFLPGGITVSFSGHDIRHINAGPLQRLGLQPAVTVTVTLNGMRAHRDEVLSGALQYLSR